MAGLRGFLACSALLLATSSISVVSGQSAGEWFISESELIQHYVAVSYYNKKKINAVHISLNGVTIPNNSYVLTSDIGTHDAALHCNTDRSDCCRASDNPDGVVQGQWYYPDGGEVRSFTQESMSLPGDLDFFSRDRVEGAVRLSRFGIPPEVNRGRFCCEIPDDSGSNVTIYVSIGEWFVSP